MPEQLNILFDQALNKRLGTEGLNIPQLARVAAERDMTLEEVMAMPEKDGWIYTGSKPRDGWSYVCSSYVVAVMKAAGLFDDLEINATEFTPRDLYQLDIYDKDFKRPEVCNKVDPD